MEKGTQALGEARGERAPSAVPGNGEDTQGTAPGKERWDAGH